MNHTGLTRFWDALRGEVGDRVENAMDKVRPATPKERPTQSVAVPPMTRDEPAPAILPPGALVSDAALLALAAGKDAIARQQTYSALLMNGSITVNQALHCESLQVAPPAPQVDPTEAELVDAEASAILPHDFVNTSLGNSSAVEPPAVNRMVAGSNPASSATSAAPVAEIIPTGDETSPLQGDTTMAASAQPVPAAAPAPAPESKIKEVEQEFIGVLETIGKDFEKGLAVTVKYLPEASVLAGFIYPPSVAITAPAITTADLLQKTIAAAEQQYAAMGQQNGTGAAKAATVLTVVQASVTQLLADPTVKAGLAAAKITVSPAYIQNLISAVVGILNVQAPQGA